MKRHDIVTIILSQAAHQEPPQKRQGRAFAPANIALCKYWGKRDEELNLPHTPSLSISLGQLGTETTVAFTEGEADLVTLNGKSIDPGSDFHCRIISFIDLFRTVEGPRWRIDTRNSIPTAAGLASSASGFAALVKALNDWFDWGLDPQTQSILARLGSGSACRSVLDGFVLWHEGSAPDGMDSFAERLDITWPEFRIGLWTLSTDRKPVSSRVAMKRTVDTSILYQSWPEQCRQDLARMKQAMEDRDLSAVGRIAEQNALAMHATGLGAWPPVLFWLPESVEAMKTVWMLREQGLEVYLTMDAGPNVKLIFNQRDEAAIRESVPTLKTIAPFGDG